MKNKKLSPEEKLERIRLLEEKKKLHASLPHLYGMKFYQWAYDFFHSTNKMNILVAGNQLSKSSTQIRKAIHWSTDPSIWPTLWPGRTPRQFWYMYPSSYVATIEVEKKWMEEFLPKKELKDHPLYGWRADYRAKYIQAIHFNAGPTIYFKTYSQNPSDLQSGTCLNRDATLLTNRGVLPISDVLVSDYVFGRRGWNKVLSTSVRMAEVVTCGFSNKKTLTCTPEHPIFSNGDWNDFANIRVGDKCVGSISVELLSLAALLFSKTSLVTSRLLAVKNFIVKNGKSIISKLSQKILSFTISTMTRAITGLQICRLCIQRSILVIMQQFAGKQLQQNGLPIVISAVSYLDLDMRLSLDTVATAAPENLTLKKLFALSVEQKLKEGWIQNRFFALKNVQILALREQKTLLERLSVLVAKSNLRQGLELLFHALYTATGSTIVKIKDLEKIRRAQTVVKNFLLRTTELNVVPVNVPLYLGKKENVYNLTVDGDHTYFANGILVHNCDAIFCDEEIDPALMSELQARLFASDGYFHICMTPTSGFEYWREAVEIRGHRERFPNALKLQVSIYDCLKYMDGTNSFWTLERIEQIKNQCKNEQEIQRRVYGKFVLDEGLKYQSFDPGRNLIDPFEIPFDWPIYVGVDSGSGGKFSHPSAVAFVAMRPDFQYGVVFKGRRFDGYQMTNSDLVTIVRDMKSEFGDRVAAVHYDYSAPDLFTIASQMGETWLPAEKSHLIGEQFMNVSMKNKMLQIFNIDELAPLVGELKSLKLSTPKNQAHDDYCDALRYAITRINWDWSHISGRPIETIPKEKTENELRREFISSEDIIDYNSVQQELDAYQELFDDFY